MNNWTPDTTYTEYTCPFDCGIAVEHRHPTERASDVVVEVDDNGNVRRDDTPTFTSGRPVGSDYKELEEIKKCFLTERLTDYPVPTVRVNPDTLLHVVRTLLATREAKAREHYESLEADLHEYYAKKIQEARESGKEAGYELRDKEYAKTLNEVEVKCFAEGEKAGREAAVEHIKREALYTKEDDARHGWYDVREDDLDAARISNSPQDHA
jgi:hypothetical protein